MKRIECEDCGKLMSWWESFTTWIHHYAHLCVDCAEKIYQDLIRESKDHPDDYKIEPFTPLE